jgi:hypothetical protein
MMASALWSLSQFDIYYIPKILKRGGPVGTGMKVNVHVFFKSKMKISEMDIYFCPFSKKSF